MPLCLRCHAAAHGCDGEAPQGFSPPLADWIVDRSIFLYERGYTLWEICRYWYERGVKTPRGSDITPASLVRPFERRGVQRRPRGRRRKEEAGIR